MATNHVLRQLSHFARLEVVEGACAYPRTLLMNKHHHQAHFEQSYSNLESFQEAVNAAKETTRIKRIGAALSLHIILASLVDLFETALIDTVDSVLIHHGGSTLIRFTNTTKTPNNDSCSIFLAVSKVRVGASAHLDRILDRATPIVIHHHWLVSVAVGALIGMAGMKMLNARGIIV